MNQYFSLLGCCKFLLSSLLIIIHSHIFFAQNDSLFTIVSANTEDKEVIQLINDKIQLSLYQAPQVALENAEILDSILLGISDIYSKAETKNSLGLALYVNQIFDKAILEMLASLRMFEEINREDKIARLSNSLAIVYQVRTEPRTSALYWERSLRIFEKLNDSLWIANVASNLGGHYMEHDSMNKADLFFDRACPIFEAIGRPGMLGYAKLNQGSNRVKQKRYVEAVSAFDMTFELIPYSTNPLIHAVAHTGRGNAHLELRHWKRAKEDLQKGYDISVEIGQFEQQVPATELLSRYYEAIGDYKKALLYHKERAVLQDSFLTSEEDTRLVEALKKYETEKKEQEITLLSAENKIKDLRIQTESRNLQFAILGLLGLAGFSFYFYRSRQRTHHLNNILQNQKDLISKSLKEKEFLLKEIHHRVKNNLQVISSLLKLQSRSVKDRKAQQALDEGRSRVRSMALIHQNLYQDESCPEGIIINNYIDQLTSELLESYNLEARIKFVNEVDELTLDVDTVVPIGLIINELMTNSLKYAFPDDREGEISVYLTLKEDGILELIYTDNGVGYDVIPVDPKSFGLRLVKSFAERLDASYKLEGEKGSRAVFAIRDYNLAS